MPRLMLCIIGCAALTGCSPSGTEYQRAGTPSLRFELRRASMERVHGWEPIDSPVAAANSEPLFLAPTPELTNDDLQSAGVELDSTGNWTVVLRLNEQAKARFGELSRKMARETTERERLAFIIDGELIVAPFVTAPMTAGLIPVSGPFSEDEARRLAKGIVGR